MSDTAAKVPPLALTEAIGERYRLERELGRGGMATVYLAHDIKHDRKVAIKVLDPELGAVLGAERFLSEIKVTANLQHPNLLPLFDSGEAGGLLYYVMPFVDGETLRHRLDREKQLSIESAVGIAVAVTYALAYAHERGIVHRDLKPENILFQAKQPVVADFGIALAVSNAGGQRVTQTGLSLGTPQYMSPEQAIGDRGIDARADIYALGAMLYEMLTGEPPHSGASAQAVIAKLLTEEARPASLIRRNVPVYVDAAISRALSKLPADRFENAKDFAAALQGRGDLPSLTVGVAPRIFGSQNGRVRAREIVAWTLLAVAAAALGWSFARPRAQTDSPVLRSVVDVPAGASLRLEGAAGVAIAPLGDRYAFVVQDSSGTGIVIRGVDELGGKRIAATQPGNLVFSPDGQWLAFSTETDIRKIRVDGSAATVLGKSPIPISDISGMVWASTNVLYAGSVNYGIWKTPASTGDWKKLLPDATGYRATHPVLSDDEKVLVFARVGSGADRRAG